MGTGTWSSLVASVTTLPAAPRLLVRSHLSGRGWSRQGPGTSLATSRLTGPSRDTSAVTSAPQALSQGSPGPSWRSRPARSLCLPRYP